MDKLYCRECGKTYGLDEPVWHCTCGGLLDLQFTPQFDPDRIRTRPPTLWRYREALPIRQDGAVTSFGEGFTPLLPVELGGRRVLVKQDHLFPSGSYKDRGAAVLISKARELGIRHVVEDSSGNAGCAVAAYCARAGIACDIYVPESTSPGKLAQIEMYGARLIKVPGSREDTARAVWAAAQEHYYASHSWNPFFFQGTKTWAYEVCEQLGWQAPDTVILPAGNGTLLLGAFYGFQDLRRAGITNRLPKMIAVQSANCAPLYAAFEHGSGSPEKVVSRETLAEGIAIAEPVRGPQILAAVRETGGSFRAVGEAEIQQALVEMTRQGDYIEPTAAATIAAAKQYAGAAGEGEVVVTVFTGHGLKSTEKMLKLAHGDH